ncbi:MAG TPA: hypothetical protein VFI25_03740 [Planctomycetota bacterium]|nr:hypothetical protein [Planctomycetota bacterium]
MTSVPGLGRQGQASGSPLNLDPPWRRIRRVWMTCGWVLASAGSLPATAATLAQLPRTPTKPGPTVGPHSSLRLGPTLKVFGERAILGMRASPGSELRVEYGPTPALGSHAIGHPDASASPSTSGELRYEAVLDGLQTGRTCYYRAALLRGGAVISETAVDSFNTPRILLRVRPHRIDVIKDGDRDIFGQTNKGEMAFSWRVALDPRSPIWPEADVLGGCYPAGGTWTVGVPTSFRIPYNLLNLPGGAPPPPYGSSGNAPGSPPSSPQNPYYPPFSLEGCVEGSSHPGSSVRPNTTKVKSGQEIELRGEAQEWVIPDGMPVAQALGPTTDKRREASKSASPLLPRMPPDGTPFSPPGPPPPNASPPAIPPPCESRKPLGAFLPVYAWVKGFEIDEIDDPRTGEPNIRVRPRQKASGSEVECFDLREPARTAMLGVKAEGSGISFILWFQVDLIYRRW